MYQAETWGTLGGIVVTRADVKGYTPLSLVGNAGHTKRVMGFEPTTFTLATWGPTDANVCNDNDLANQDPIARSACAAPSTSEPDSEDKSAGSLSPELATVVTAWPELPEPIKVGIVAMVYAAGGGGRERQ